MRWIEGFILFFSILTARAEDFDPVLPSPPTVDKFFYVSGGLAGIAPKVSLGIRLQKGKAGMDLSFTEASLIELYSQGLQFNQLYYPKPNSDKQLYFGISEGVHFVFTTGSTARDIGSFFDCSLGVLLGYQFLKNSRHRFIEGKVGFPIDISGAAKFPVPIPSLSYGIFF